MDAVDHITWTGGARLRIPRRVCRREARGQEFVVDAVLALPLRRAAETDDVRDTVHYGELAERLVAVVEGEPVDLLETLAQRLADDVLRDARIDAVTITVHKPTAPITVPFGDVSVTITRGRS